MVNKTKLILQALKDNLNRVERRYRWTGKGNEDIRCTIPGQTFVKTVERNIWQFYDIVFETAIKKNHKIEVEVLYDLEDSEHKAKPFLGTTIEEPTKLLCLKVKLPVSFGVKTAIVEVTTHLGASKPLESKKLEFDRDGLVKYLEYNPRLLHHYELKWLQPE